MKNVLRTGLLAVLWLVLLGLMRPPVDAVLYRWRLASMPPAAMVDMPLKRVRPASLRDSWHADRPGGRRHEGIDIFAPSGTPVYSSTEGIVTRTGRNRLGGNVVWVAGPGGQRHYYAHLSGFALLSPGQRIEAGTLLGYVGNTGNARTTPPHLHYGIYTRNGAINPFPLLVAAID